MARLVCLANSKRPDGRCLAGIDLDTRQWVRPVPPDMDAISDEKCFIGGKFIELLDVIEIDLADLPSIPRYQRENRTIKNWNWKLLGRHRRANLAPFFDDRAPMLHGMNERMTPAAMDKLPPHEWQSLQLLRARNVRFEPDGWQQHRWRARFRDGVGNECWLRITDPVATRRLEVGERLSRDCVLTISLTKPWGPADGSKPAYCYKLVAAVIEL